MKSTSKLQMAYGAFLILVGLIGYLSNPEKAKTALMSGGSFGALHIALGFLNARGWRRSVPIALVVCAMLAVVFSWRSVVTWMKHFEGEPAKLVPGVLISSMLVATLAMIGVLWRAWKGAGGPGPSGG